MVWFKVDDTFAFHQKCVAAGNAAVGLWTRAGSWCAAQLNDGFVPDHMIASLGTKGQATRLVTVNLWTREDGGFRFHQWNEDGRQPTREEVEAKRQEWRDKKRKQRRDKDTGQYESSPAVSQGDSPGDSRESPAVPSRPVPSRPSLPTEETSKTPHRGVTEVDANDAHPPLYSDRCTRHGDVLAPEPCGQCADVRKANAERPRALSLVTDTEPWPLHCGRCDETRHLTTPVGVIRCPECHPLAEEIA